MCTEDQLELPDAWFMAHCCVRLTSLHGEDDAHWDALKRSPPAEQEHDASEWWRFAYFELQLAEILAWSKREMTTAEMTVKRKSCRKHQRCPQAPMQRTDRNVEPLFLTQTLFVCCEDGRGEAKRTNSSTDQRTHNSGCATQVWQQQVDDTCEGTTGWSGWHV